ncbi:hypothetical protein ACRALDRAFT_211697 [Sodiomyces alcalophilus JCM 7366]|uniref:uncharacterized protein n=1 Tax=Sodiomyces alcalophilus JCM 7366 TaxID=591952 RepID=UPI0039B480A0
MMLQGVGVFKRRMELSSLRQDTRVYGRLLDRRTGIARGCTRRGEIECGAFDVPVAESRVRLGHFDLTWPMLPEYDAIPVIITSFVSLPARPSGDRIKRYVGCRLDKMPARTPVYPIDQLEKLSSFLIYGLLVRAAT